MTAPEGVLVVHLHAHLPDVRAPGDWAEDWYFGAVFDAYLPLLEVVEGWLRDGVAARVSLSVSPPLVAMMEDVDLAARCAARLRGLRTLAVDRARRGASPAEPWYFFGEVAERRLHRFERRYDRDLLSALRRLESSSVLELGTSSASHAYLPFLAAIDPALVDAQVGVGVRRHTRCFGRAPTGFWLPECAYAAGLDARLARAGIGHFFVDAHAARGAVFGTAAPLLTPAGLVALPRDVECAVRVWSPDHGYPTDPRYREFHRDIGRELDADALARADLPSDGRPLGIKIHRITDRGLDARAKQPYEPIEGQRAAEEHADDFVRALAARAGAFRAETGRSAVIVAPYDAELFGHWWFEGPMFLDRLARTLAVSRSLQLWSGADVVRARPRLERREPAETSWGRGGFASTWLTPRNHWVQDRIADVSRRMLRAARRHAQSGTSALEDAWLNAMAEATLGIAASDWPFLMTAGTFSDYAERTVEASFRKFEAAERGLMARAAAPPACAPDVTWQLFLARDPELPGGTA
jgi:1,4-alpha-glucan branching enzyme